MSRLLLLNVSGHTNNGEENLDDHRNNKVNNVMDYERNMKRLRDCKWLALVHLRHNKFEDIF